MSKKVNLATLPLISLVLATLLLGCTPQISPSATAQPTASAPKPTATAPPASKTPSGAAWQAEWDRVLAEAKKEGKASIYLSEWGNTVRATFMEEVKKAYGINVEVITQRGAEIPPRVLAERRAGIYNYDVFMGGTTTPLTALKPAGVFDKLEPALILPDVTDPAVIQKTWFQGKLWWIDNDHTLLMSFVFPNLPLAINTTMVKEGEIKSFKDLLDPKWKDKIIFSDPTIPGISGSSFLPMTVDLMGMDWVVGLGKNSVIIRDQRLMLDWLAHGKAAVVAPPNTAMYIEFKRAGSPIQGLIPQEGTWLAAGESGISIFNKPAHPNAAKVLINWIMSKEGETALGQAYGGQSGREDVSADFVPQELRRQPGVKYWQKEREDVILGGGAIRDKAKELLAPYMK